MDLPNESQTMRAWTHSILMDVDEVTQEETWTNILFVEGIGLDADVVKVKELTKEDVDLLADIIDRAYMKGRTDAQKEIRNSMGIFK